MAVTPGFTRRLLPTDQLPREKGERRGEREGGVRAEGCWGRPPASVRVPCGTQLPPLSATAVTQLFAESVSGFSCQRFHCLGISFGLALFCFVFWFYLFCSVVLRFDLLCCLSSSFASAFGDTVRKYS